MMVVDSDDHCTEVMRNYEIHDFYRLLMAPRVPMRRGPLLDWIKNLFRA
jgi:hypothetical protein